MAPGLASRSSRGRGRSRERRRRWSSFGHTRGSRFLHRGEAVGGTGRLLGEPPSAGADWPWALPWRRGRTRRLPAALRACRTPPREQPPPGRCSGERGQRLRCPVRGIRTSRGIDGACRLRPGHRGAASPRTACLELARPAGIFRVIQRRFLDRTVTGTPVDRVVDRRHGLHADGLRSASTGTTGHTRRSQVRAFLPTRIVSCLDLSPSLENSRRKRPAGPGAMTGVAGPLAGRAIPYRCERHRVSSLSRERSGAAAACFPIGQVPYRVTRERDACGLPRHTRYRELVSSQERFLGLSHG